MIDATHPFASAVSQVAITAAQQTGIDYLRLERPTIKLPDDPLVIGITDLARLEDYVLPGQRVFSTLGSKYLATIMPIIRRKQADLIARVLPSSTVLKNCEELGLHPNQLIAMQGPFSMNLNLELFRQYSADLIISKESGVLGGLEAKIGAALKLGLRILVWSRPVINYPRCFDSSQSLMEYINSEERDVR